MATRLPTPDQIPQLKTEQARGAAAKHILENEVFKAVMQERWDKLIESWLATAPDDVVGREWFHQQAVAQRALIKGITHTVNTGTMADMALKLVPKDTPRRKR